MKRTIRTFILIAFVAGLFFASCSNPTDPDNKVSTPVFNPAGGTYENGVEVSITTSTLGTTILYTTDGSDPDSNSPVYTGPIFIAETTTLKAKAYRTGMIDSTIASAVYTINVSIITIQPGTEGTDVWITSVYYGGGLNDDKLVVGGWADSYYSMIMFDLSTLPSDVQSAKIMLYSYTNTASFHPTMYLHRITSSWNESTKWISKPSTTLISTVPAAANNTWYEIDITALYNNWKSGTYPNHGIQLRPSSTDNAYNTFYSSDYMEDPSLRPKLVIIP